MKYTLSSQVYYLCIRSPSQWSPELNTSPSL